MSDLTRTATIEGASDHSGETLELGSKSERRAEPCIVVIFGASGDLTRRKLMPAMFHLKQEGLLPEDFAVVGVARRDLSASFGSDMRDGILKGGGVDSDDPALASFMNRVRYFATEFDSDKGFASLKAFLEELDAEYGTKANRLFYLAVAPEYFSDIVERLDKHGMAHPAEGTSSFVRVIIEKPFGTDLETAKKLNDDVNAVLSEDQIFRIDHYLGKETVQNILIFRFGNGMFEPLWNREFIDHVEITAAESIGIEGRGPFYEKAGALRDVLQNHVMEVLSFVAMEPPPTFQADTVRTEKLKVWTSILPLAPEDVVRGQYGSGVVGDTEVSGYRSEERVAADSQTETFAAARLSINNWRWAGVPFYVRAGKRLKTRVTEINVVFKPQPIALFPSSAGANSQNVVTLRIQPDEGISLRFGVKVPGATTEVRPVKMQFDYSDSFGHSFANGYERLLLDAMLGDGTLFTHREGVEATWALFTPVLERWAQGSALPVAHYAAGSWGPDEANELLQKDGRSWQKQ